MSIEIAENDDSQWKWRLVGLTISIINRRSSIGPGMPLGYLHACAAPKSFGRT